MTEPGQVAEAMAAALEAGGVGDIAEEALVKALHSRKLLLVLDNAEHQRRPTSRLLKLIFARCPEISALVTSRESLGLPGEAVFRLAPMALPPTSSILTAAKALDYDAVRLFADRARALLRISASMMGTRLMSRISAIGSMESRWRSRWRYHGLRC